MSDFDPGLMGPILRPIFDSIVDELTPGRVDARTLCGHVEMAAAALPKTVENLLRDLSKFGLVHRVRGKHPAYELTVLGRQWLDTGGGAWQRCGGGLSCAGIWPAPPPSGSARREPPRADGPRRQLAGPGIGVSAYESIAAAIARPAWMADANCRGMNPEKFFPDRGQNTAEARAVCGGCPVRTECLGYAMANAEKLGIWGGLSESDRRSIRFRIGPRRCRLSVCGTVFEPLSGGQRYCRPEHAAAAAAARKSRTARQSYLASRHRAS